VEAPTIEHVDVEHRIAENQIDVLSCPSFGTSKAQDLETVELVVESRRVLSKKLFFLTGRTLQSDGGPLQIVFDRSTMDHTSLEVQLLREGPVVGEQIRTRGSRVEKPDGSGCEIVAFECVVLRPLTMLEDKLHPAQPPPERKKGGRGKFRALPAADAAAEAISRLSCEDRLTELCKAALDGDVIRIVALANVGVEVDAVLNEYGHTALFVASLHGRSAAVRRLIELRASVTCRSHGGATAATAAAANGHAEVLRLLQESGADCSIPGSEGKTPAEYLGITPVAARSPSAQRGDARLFELQVPEDHPGVGSCYIDGGFTQEVLSALTRLCSILPVAGNQRSTQGRHDRHYFCDAEGWVSCSMLAAVRAVGDKAPCMGVAMRYMRFLVYNEAGGGLPPHLDLSRTDEVGQTSSHTFILYLTDCDAGGETMIISSLFDPKVFHRVTPRRGRLLIFPHACPHMAGEVVAKALPKILLRGELF